MRRTICIVTASPLLVLAITAFAQRGAQPARGAEAAAAAAPPSLFFRETWKTRPTGTPTNTDIPISPSFVANPNLELKLYAHANELIMPVQGDAAPPETGPLTYAWSGIV